MDSKIPTSFRRKDNVVNHRHLVNADADAGHRSDVSYGRDVECSKFDVEKGCFAFTMCVSTCLNTLGLSLKQPKSKLPILFR